MNKLVSIITPVFNAEKFLADAIDSVLNQEHQDWELLLINDGSTDASWTIAKSYQDVRIRFFEQPNRGVSAARNVGLKHMKGDFFCFLDADDILTINSIASRLLKFDSDASVSFVDGKVEVYDHTITTCLSSFIPSYEGDPIHELTELKNNCFFGPSWMIKRSKGITYHFEEQMTHLEDLFFYISTCVQKKQNYSFVNDTVLLYRRSDASAMRNLSGLERGYLMLVDKICSLNLMSVYGRIKLKAKVMKIMFLSYWFDGRQPIQAIKSIFRIIGR